MKGSHAFHILVPCTKKIEGENGEERFVVYGFKSAPVFRLEDTDGDPLPDADPHVINWIQSLPLRNVAVAWGLTVDAYSGKSGKAHGWYSPKQNAIALGVENVSTWLHELMHAADHRLGNLAEKGQHWRAETVAEFGSAVLAECLGYHRESDLGGAYEYIRNYAETAGKRPENAALECLDRICKAVALILETAESLQAESVAA